MPLALYGVVRPDHPVPDGAAGGPRLAVVSSGELAVVAAELDPDHEPVEEGAVTHLEVLSRLVLDGPVLPFSFGTVAPDADAVLDEVLAERADELEHLLQALDGMVEVQVQVTFDEQAGLEAAVATDARLQELAARARSIGAGLDERIRLGEQVLAGVTQWWHARAEELLKPVADLAERSVGLEGAEAHQVRTAYLLRRDRLADVERAVPQVVAAAGPDVEVRAVAPLPAYSFLADPDLLPPPSSSSRWGW